MAKVAVPDWLSTRRRGIVPVGWWSTRWPGFSWSGASARRPGPGSASWAGVTRSANLRHGDCYTLRAVATNATFVEEPVLHRTPSAALAAIVLAILFTVATSVTAVADQPAREETDVVGGLSFADEVEVTVVNLSVFVTDKDGDSVTDLGADDFRILQDGEPREISNFTVYTEERFESLLQADRLQVPEPVVEAPQPEVASTPSKPEFDPVHVVLFIDNEQIRPIDRNRVLRQVRRFIREIMYPNVRVMVVVHERSMRVIQQFTSDRDEINTALREVGKMTGGRTERDRERREILRDLGALRNTFQKQQMSSIEFNDLYGRIRGYADSVAFDLDHSIESARQVTTMIAGLPGRKFMVHVSSGLPMVPGRDLFNDLATIFQETPMLMMNSRYDQRRKFNQLASTANSQGVSFFTIDATGLGGSQSAVSAEYVNPIDPMTASLYITNNQEPLSYMAEKTGGYAVLNTNDVTVGLQRLRQDLFTYYSIGYAINASGGDTVHQIDVRLPEHPEYDLRFRRTIVEKSIETEVQDTVASGLMFELNHNPMDIRVTTEPAVPASEDRWLLPLEVAIPLKSIALIPQVDDYLGEIVLFVAARDEKGKQSDMVRRRFDVRVPASDYDDLKEEYNTFELKLLMETGSYRLSVGVLDRVTRQSSFTLQRSEITPRGGR